MRHTAFPKISNLRAGESLSAARADFAARMAEDDARRARRSGLGGAVAVLLHGQDILDLIDAGAFADGFTPISGPVDPEFDEMPA